MENSKKEKKSQPGKIGKVGRKKMEDIDKVCTVSLYPISKDVEEKGGKEHVSERLMASFKRLPRINKK